MAFTNSNHAITCNDMIPAIGARVSAKFEDLRITCTVLNVKSSYGRVRLLVSPMSGTGEQWIEMSRIRMIQSNEKALSL